MHMLPTDPRVLHLYLPWLAAALAGALELEWIHRLRRLLFGVHPVPAGARWLALCAAGLAAAPGLSYALIYICAQLNARTWLGWVPWAVGLVYLTVVAERERHAARAARRVVVDREEY
jgi:hypothetical protein